MSGARQISGAVSFGGQLLEEGTAFVELGALDRRTEDATRSPGPIAEQHEVIVIGGGQAGLSVGYHLQREGVPFVILDARARIGDTWRERWDSLRLFTPRRFNGLDGLRNYLGTTRRDTFVRQFCRKLLGYALGRSVQLSDEPLLDEMLHPLDKSDYRFSVALETIVLSDQFRKIRGRDDPRVTAAE